MKKKKIIITSLQVLFVFIAVFSFVSYNNSKLEPEKVLVFSKELEAGHKISEKDLKSIEMAKSSITQNMILEKNKKDVLGKFTKGTSYKDNLIFKNGIEDTQKTSKFEAINLENSRVTSIPISFAKAANAEFQKGDTVDLLLMAKGSVPKTNGNEQSNSTFYYSKLFMQNIPVYSVNTPDGENFISGNLSKDEDKEKKEGKSSKVASVSLIVTPAQLEEIKAKSNYGEIEIVKRFPESKNVETAGYIVGDYGKIYSGSGNAETDNLIINEAIRNTDTGFEVNAGIENKNEEDKEKDTKRVPERQTTTSTTSN